MKKFCSISLILSLVAGLVSPGAFAQDAADDDDGQPTAAPVPASTWPLKFEDNGTSYVVYPPRYDSWANGRLEGRSAVAVTRPGAEAPEFGVVWLSAQTETRDGVVTVRGQSVTKADFPADAGNSAQHAAALERRLGAYTWEVAQARLQNDLEIDKAAQGASTQPVKNDVPQILFSERPAILVPVDGAPALRDVGGTGLKRVVNTRALLVSDPATGRYYLYVSDHWMQAQKLDGPWERAATAPAQLEQAKEAAVKEGQVDLLAPEEGEAPLPASPSIYVSTAPAELLQTDGPPQYSPVEGTHLLYVANSPNRIFLDTSTQTHYVLLSGRWFRTRSLGATGWEYVAASGLPADFAQIPDSHPAESVRESVAGTPQAREAAIENSVPQVATVTRSATHLNVTYDGDPSFHPVEGTSLQRAVNAPIPVIRVGENTFYALDNGVWFVAASPFGPWTVAATVPAAIYAIPRSSPLHYVTYVRVYDASPEVVYVGYTPGYVGSYVSTDAVVVYGTGWTYRPWIGSVWYSAPVTWGFGFSFARTWWRPWRPCCVAWAPPPPCFRPAWGPWYSRPSYRANVTVVNNVTVNRVDVHRTNVTRIYNRWDRGAVVADRGARPNRPRMDGVPGPGRGYVTRPDGSRQNLGDGRQDWRQRDRTAERRDGQAGPPPVQRPRREWQGNPRADAREGVQPRSGGLPPRIQGPDGARERDPAQRADRGQPQWRQPDGRDDRPPRVAGSEAQRRNDWRTQGRAIDQPGRRDLPAVQTPQVPRQERRDFGANPRQPGSPQPQVARPERTNPQFERRNFGQGERRDFARQERRDAGAAGSARPQAVPPSVHARPQMPQAQRPPQARAESRPPRMERSNPSPRQEARQRSGGGQRPEARGGGFRPEAR